MDIDNLTIGEAKKIALLMASIATKMPENKIGENMIGENMIGQYVIVRSRNEGINAGYVEEMDETGIVLKDARRIWYHNPADKNQSWYEGVANTGLSEKSKISASVTRKVIIENYSITQCTDIAIESITGFKSHAQG